MLTARRLSKAATAQIADKPVGATNFTQETAPVFSRQFFIWKKLKLLHQSYF
jgi:hypothetical protein